MTRVIYLNCESGEETEEFFPLPKKDVCKIVRNTCKKLSLGWGAIYHIYVTRSDGSTYRMYRHYPKRISPRKRGKARK